MPSHSRALGIDELLMMGELVRCAGCGELGDTTRFALVRWEGHEERYVCATCEGRDAV